MTREAPGGLQVAPPALQLGVWPRAQARAAWRRLSPRPFDPVGTGQEGVEDGGLTPLPFAVPWAWPPRSPRALHHGARSPLERELGAMGTVWARTEGWLSAWARPAPAAPWRGWARSKGGGRAWEADRAPRPRGAGTHIYQPPRDPPKWCPVSHTGYMWFPWLSSPSAAPTPTLSPWATTRCWGAGSSAGRAGRRGEPRSTPTRGTSTMARGGLRLRRRCAASRVRPARNASKTTGSASGAFNVPRPGGVEPQASGCEPPRRPTARKPR